MSEENEATPTAHDAAESAEPVAYLVKHADGGSHLMLADTVDARFRAALVAEGRTVAALYTHPTPAASDGGLREAFDFRAHLQRQREWSGQTFGPGPRTAGVVDHIRKELREIEADPADLSEWIDVAILALDGAWRAGYSPDDIIAALVGKQTKNEGRVWPDWRTMPADKAIEHDRAHDAPPTEQAKPSEGAGAEVTDADIDAMLAAPHYGGTVERYLYASGPGCCEDDERELLRSAGNVLIARHASNDAPHAEHLPAFLDRIASELVAQDTVYGSYARGVASSLQGRAIILRQVYGETGRPALSTTGAPAAG